MRVARREQGGMRLRQWLSTQYTVPVTLISVFAHPLVGSIGDKGDSGMLTGQDDLQSEDFHMLAIPITLRELHLVADLHNFGT